MQLRQVSIVIGVVPLQATLIVLIIIARSLTHILTLPTLLSHRINRKALVIFESFQLGLQSFLWEFCPISECEDVKGKAVMQLTLGSDSRLIFEGLLYRLSFSHPFTYSYNGHRL